MIDEKKLPKMSAKQTKQLIHEHLNNVYIKLAHTIPS